MSENYSVWFEKNDFNRDVYMYVVVANDGFLRPDGDSFTVAPEKKPFMQFNPAILDLKELILEIYEAIVRDEKMPAVNPQLRAAFDEEVGLHERRSLRP